MLDVQQLHSFRKKGEKVRNKTSNRIYTGVRDQ